MLIKQIFELKGPGPPGCICTSITACFHDKTIISKENIRLDCYLVLKYCRRQCNCNCNCNYILFTKLPWPGDSEGTFRSSSQAATCPSVYHTRWRLHTVPSSAERQAGKLWIPIFIVFGLTRPRIELVSTASVADALSTRPLIGYALYFPLTWAKSVTKFNPKMHDFKRVLDVNC